MEVVVGTEGVGAGIEVAGIVAGDNIAVGSELEDLAGHFVDARLDGALGSPHFAFYSLRSVGELVGRLVLLVVVAGPYSIAFWDV